MKLLGLFLTVTLLASSSWAGDLLDITPKKLPTGKLVEAVSLINGLTVYTFDPDTADKSNCSGTCAEKWPPVILTDEEILSLPDVSAKIGAALGVVKRSSGLNQLTVGGRLVYTFYVDRKSGDAKGDGAGGVWHVISIGPVN